MLTRRRFLQITAFSSLAALLGYIRLTPTNQPTASSTVLSSPIPVTPNAGFFVEWYKFGDPPEIPRDWRLDVQGQVDHPLHLSLDDIRALPSVVEMRTLMCISNVSGGDAIGNAIWRGVKLRDLLLSAGIQASAREIRLESFDGYDTSIPIALALDDHSLLVYEMNNVPLPQDHGAPLRCLFPGRYGQKQPKWIRTITAIAENHLGHWERVGWSNEAIVLPHSRIVTPETRARITTPTFSLQGIAFANETGVAKLEIGWDDVTEWREANLTRAPSPLAWATWVWTGETLPAGWHQIFAQTTDGQGHRQTFPLPTGAGDSFPSGSDTMAWSMLEFL